MNTHKGGVGRGMQTTGGTPRVGLGSGEKETGILCGLRTDCGEGTILVSGCTVDYGRNVLQGRSAD